MISNKNKKINKIIYLSIILVFLAVNSIIFKLNSDPANNSSDNDINSREILSVDTIKDQGWVYEDVTEEWLENGNFTSGTDPWYSTIEGDNKDVKASYNSSLGAANYEVLGEVYTYSDINGTPTSAKGWTKSKNFQYPAEPNLYASLTAYGGRARHHWSESALQQVVVQWDKQILMNRNMSDYYVTAASLNMTVNATVHSNPGYTGDNSWGGLDVSASESEGGAQFNVGDFVRYFVCISDQDKIKNYTDVISYKTSGLGANHGTGNQYDYLYATVIEIDDENDLINLLNNLFHFYNNYNITITIGMFLNCEDNYSSDDDFFEGIYITSVNFTFSYRKNIDQGTKISWNQVGDKIEGENVEVKSAKLNFKYLSNPLWPDDSLNPDFNSLNAEFRIIINGTQFPETIKLTKATTFFQEAKVGGFDVGYLIKKNVNIALSIQVYLADEFRLDKAINISIDDVSLNITYTIGTEETPTEIQLFLNGQDKTLDKSIVIPWRENINISVEYNTTSGAFISDAYVTLNGTGVSEVLMDYGYNNYTVVINSTKLAFGNNYLTLNAEEKYYEAIPPTTIKITVIDRPTFIDNILLNYTEQTSIEMQYNTILNISISYNDTLTTDFVSGATVSINGSISYPMPENSQKQYSVEINTTNLKSGLNFFTIRAQKENYSLSTEPITIAVNIKDAYLNVSVNNIPTTELEAGYYAIPYGELLNITAGYFEADNDNFINEATVKLITTNETEDLLTLTMPKHIDYDQYNITINSTIFGVTVRSVTISAQKANFTWISETFSVIVTERATQMQLWLNNTLREETTPTYELNVNQILNINVTYKEAGKHLSEAEGTRVRIFGGGIDDDLTEIISLEQYFYSLNSSNLNSSINLINIFAEREGYETQYKLITIMVKERNTSIELFLNGTNFTYISSYTYNLTIGNYLNITIKYIDWLTKTHIIEASVDLEGENINKELDENDTFEQYSIILDSEELNQGVNFLTVTAYKSNYQPRQKQIRIEVRDKASLFSLYIDGDNRTDETFINLIWGNPLNFTVFYLENASKQLIPSATVEIREGSTLLYNLIKHPFYNQYNRSINTADLGVGTRSLLFIAYKINYETITKFIVMTISERNTDIQVFLNGTPITYNGNRTVETTQIFNITVMFKDNITKQHIPTANVELLGIDALDDNIYGFYNITLKIIDLKQEGLANLNIFANKTNYKTQLFQFFLKIVQKQTNLDIFFNGLNYTISPVLDLPIGALVNLTINFTDSIGIHIPGASVKLGSDYQANLTESNNLYTIIIDTNLLELGVNIISFEAYKSNFEIQTENIQITLRRISTKIETEDGEDKYEIRPGESITITVEVTEDEAIYGFIAKIDDADVTYEWKLEDGDFEEEDDGVYEVTLENVPEGTYTITISVYKSGGKYDFEDLEITLVVKAPTEENLLFRILLIIAIIAGVALGSYLVVYQKYLKYPKAVRKVRKYRRTLKRKKSPSIEIISREKGFKELFSEKVGKANRYIKGKTPEETEPEDKFLKKESEDLAVEKSINEPENVLTKKTASD